MPARLASLCLTLPLAALAACGDNATPGVGGHVAFVAEACGQDDCDLSQRIAVDATVDVYLRGLGDTRIDDVRILSGDDAIAEVIAEYDDDGVPRVTVLGNAPGLVELIAVDGEGQTI